MMEGGVSPSVRISVVLGGLSSMRDGAETRLQMTRDSPERNEAVLKKMLVGAEPSLYTRLG